MNQVLSNPVLHRFLFVLSIARICAAQCTPAFDASPGAPIGFDGDVRAFALFDAGSGPRLYAGGRFSAWGAVAAKGLARWHGDAFEAVGSGVTGAPGVAVRALATFAGALYVGGTFATIDGVVAPGIARFDGTTFHPVGAGLPPGVNALATFDAGAGPRLHAAVDFNAAVPGGVFVFDAGAWTPVGGGLSMGSFGNAGAVLALAVYDDGGGAELYAGGIFHQAGGSIATHYVARFDGTAWHPLAGGLNEPVHAMRVFDAGGGQELFCGGTFTKAVSPPVDAVHAARFDGQAWHHLGNTDFSFFGSIAAIEVFDDGNGEALFLAGFNGFGPTPIFRYDGSGAWLPLATTFSGGIQAMRAVPSGCTSELFVGGTMTKVGTTAIGRAARLIGCPAPTALNALSVPQLGTDLVMSGSSPGNAGKPYFCGFALGSAPGIALPQGTLIPLNPDALLLASLDPSNPLFTDTLGAVDVGCGTTTRFHLPAIPAAVGLPIVAALVVLDGAAPDGVVAVSPAVSLVLQL